MRRWLKKYGNDRKIYSDKENFIGLIILIIILLLLFLSGCAYPSYLKTDDPRWTDYITKHDLHDLKKGEK